MSNSSSNYQPIIDYMSGVKCFNSYNNITLVKLSECYAEGRIDINSNSMNPYGAVHGGLIYAACDYVGGFVACADGRNCVTQGGSVNFLRPGEGEYLIVKASPIKIGKSIAVINVCVYDDQDRLVAVVTNNYFFKD